MKTNKTELNFQRTYTRSTPQRLKTRRHTTLLEVMPNTFKCPANKLLLRRKTIFHMLNNFIITTPCV